MAPSEQRLSFEPGHILTGRFRIVQFLGRGGMGEVYEAADLNVRQRIALKVIRSESRTDPQLLSMLREEVRQARSVGHPNVCRVFSLEHDEASGVHFVTMELIRGETLHARLKRQGRFQLAEALQVLRQIAAGMDAIHARHMLHMDLKPANVMLDSSGGESVRAIVTDFGLAKSLAPVDPDETTRSLIEFKGGTPGYMSPERFISGWALTSAADVYAFGLIAYEMLAGSAPPGGKGVLAPSVRAVVPDASEQWDEMIKGCLAPVPEDRFSNCGVALDSLNVADQTRSVPRITARYLARYRRRVLSIAGAIALAAAAFLVFRPARPEASAAALRWYNQGVDAISEGAYYQAVRALNQSIKESPDFPLAHANLAEAWLELDSPERAAEEMLRASAPGASGYSLDARSRARIQAIHNTVTRNFTAAAGDYTQLVQSASKAERPRALVDLGRALERENEPLRAVEQFETSVRLDPDYAGAYLRLAIVEGQLQKSAGMTQALQRAESLYEASSNIEGVTQVFYERGAYANREVRLSDAEQWLDRARQSALTIHNPYQVIRALYQLSAVAYQKGDSAAGQKFAEDAITEARANNIELLAGRGYLYLGSALSTRGDFAQATGYFNEALRIARNYHSGNLEAMALYSLGGIGIRNSGDEAGSRQVEQALNWFQANGYPREASYCLITLGRFRRDRGDLVGAADNFNKQLQLARASKDEFQTALALSSVASVLDDQERFPEALNSTLEELTIFKRLGDGLRTGYELQSLAELYSELGRFDESRATADEAEAVARKGKFEELQADLAGTRARTLLLAGQTEAAAAAADRWLSVYQAKYPRRAGDLLLIKAAASDDVPPATRLVWCQRSRKLAQGDESGELSSQLTEAELQLSAGNPRKALELCGEARAAFERRQNEYSLFRTELVTGLAQRQLGKKDGDAAARAGRALERFQKRFDSQAWERFRMRPDFLAWENNLLQLRPK